MRNKENRAENLSLSEGAQGGRKHTGSTSTAKPTPGRKPSADPIDLRTLINDCDRVVVVLTKKNADWTDRIAAIESLHRMALSGGTEYDEFLQCLLRLKDPIVGHIKDLRSTVVKEMCAAIEAIARGFHAQVQSQERRTLPSAWASLTMTFLDVCLKQTCVTIKVISEAAAQCVQTLIASCAPHGVAKLLTRLCSGARDKTANIRLVCVGCVSQALQLWTALPKSQHAARRWEEIKTMLKASMFDSDEQVRRTARECFWPFAACAPDVRGTIAVGCDSVFF
jgi:hypothetical protein